MIADSSLRLLSEHHLNVFGMLSASYVVQWLTGLYYVIKRGIHFCSLSRFCTRFSIFMSKIRKDMTRFIAYEPIFVVL